MLVLSAEHRLHRAADFTEVVRRGRRASRGLVTVHLMTAPTTSPTASESPVESALDPAPPRAGLVVGKAVGGSVVRSRTSRRLRHLLRDRIADLPGGARLVVRASALAGGADSRSLGADLDAALRAALAPRARR